MSAECQSCGACCRADLERRYAGAYVQLFEVDIARLSRHYRQTNLLHRQSGAWGSVAYLRTKPSGECVALRGEIGKQVNCAIYKRRPDVCRAFEPGSTWCAEARREAGMEPEPPTTSTAVAGRARAEHWDA